MPGVIIGLDVAGNTGIAEGAVNSVPLLYSKRFKLADDTSVHAALGRATAWMASRLSRNDVDAVFIEGVVPMFAMAGKTNNDATNVRMYLYGALVGVAQAKSIPVFDVNIGKVRKAFGVTSRKSADAKPEAFRLCKLRGWDPPDYDASDAAVVWNYGCGQIKTDLFGKVR